MGRTLAMILVGIAIAVGGVAASRTPDPPKPDERLKGEFKRPPADGWTYVHLEGTPKEIGFQHGYLLSGEIQDMQKVFALEFRHDDGKDWNFFREAASVLAAVRQRGRSGAAPPTYAIL